MSDQIVITGIGIVSSLGIGTEETWNSIKKEKTGIKIINEWDEYNIGNQYFGKCLPFVFKDYIKPIPPFPNYYTQLGLLATHLALKDSKIDLASIDPFEIGCVMNTTYGSNESVEKYLLKLFEKGPAKVSPITFTQTTNNHILGDIARYNQLRGPNSIIMGEECYAQAIKCIKNKQAKIMICGGLDHVRNLHLYILDGNNELLKPVSNADESLFTHEAHKNSENKRIVGECASFVILEEKRHALNRNAHIYAELLSTSSLCDTETSEFYYKRNVNLLIDLLKNNLSKANINFNELDMFLGSSSLPWQMDEYELAALNNLDLNIIYSSILSRFGDCIGASGLLNLAIAALSINESYVPGCGYQSDFFHNKSDKTIVSKNGIENQKLNYVAINSIHIGGSCNCSILKNFN